MDRCATSRHRWCLFLCQRPNSPFVVGCGHIPQCILMGHARKATTSCRATTAKLWSDQVHSTPVATSAKTVVATAIAFLRSFEVVGGTLDRGHNSGGVESSPTTLLQLRARDWHKFARGSMSHFRIASPVKSTAETLRGSPRASW